MITQTIRITACAMALFHGTVAADVPELRETISNVAQTIESGYYDPIKARQIAARLLNSAQRGEFDELTDPQDLATALTDRLQLEDRHFSVNWRANSAVDDSEVRSEPGGYNPVQLAHSVRQVQVLPGNLGYIEMMMFDHIEFDNADDPARLAIDAALHLTSATDGMIIDLRGNGGGSPAMVGYLTSAFTPKGADIYNTFYYRQGTASEAPQTWYPNPRLSVPLYVLISARTGSAAEALAYTLQNAGRAIIVGEASAGAANPGGEQEVGGGFTVFVASGSPVNPISGDNWEGDGVLPDVQVAAEDALRRARQLALEAIVSDSPNTTAQWALEALRADRAPLPTKSVDDWVGSYGAVAIEARSDRLWLTQGRRPALALIRLEADLFTLANNPSMRLQFNRDDQGQVTAVERYSDSGRARRYSRELE